MIQIAVDTLHFLMVVLFTAAITICAVVYLGRRSRTFGLFGAYFAVQLILEMIVHTSESTSLLASWVNQVFSSTVTVKGLFYGVLIFLMLLAVLSALELSARPRHMIAPAMIFIWLLCLPMLQHATMTVYWLYLLPCEMFYFGIALFGLHRMKHMKEQAFHPALRLVLYLMAIFSVIIVAEDLLAAWQYGFLTEFTGFTNPELGMTYVKERSYSESILQMVFAGMSIYIGSRLLLGVLNMEPETALEQPIYVTDSHSDAYADHIGLSAREKEILPLLLENLSIQQIGKTLFISEGTVKSHAHNIYQKAGVSNRMGLIFAASQFKQN